MFNRKVLREIFSALPRQHHLTELKPPGGGNLEEFDDIHTGSIQGEQIMPFRWRIFGLITWGIWFSFGVYYWWFTDTRFIEYIVATVMWLLTFAFTITGVPLLQLILKDRRR